jgi:conjugal transfer pilus assembly protein TraW
LDGRSLCFSLPLALSFVLAAGAAAADSAAGGADMDWLARSRSILTRGAAKPKDLPASVPDWLSRPPARLDPELEALLRQDGAGQPREEAVDRPRPERRYLFLSTGIPDAELRQALKTASSASLTAVFRGIPTRSVDEFARVIAGKAKGIEPAPAVVIDPLLFREHGIGAAPAIVLIDREGRVRKAFGTLGVDWLEREPAGDKGTRGPVHAIAETDLIEEIQRRMAGIDWQGLLERGRQNFWKQVRFAELEEAADDRARTMDPAVVVTRDIVGPDGSVLARAGQKADPLAVLPMRKAYLFFDPTRPGHLEWARATADKLGKPAVFLAARIDRARGFGHLGEVAARVPGPLYLLDPELARRFGIERIPALLEARDGRLVVHEFRIR